MAQQGQWAFGSVSPTPLFIYKMQVVAYQFVTHWIADFQVHGSGSFGEMGLVLI